MRNDNLKEKANVRLKKKFNITNKRSERGNKNKNRRRANINVNASDIKLTVKERQKFMHKRKFNVLRNWQIENQIDNKLGKYYRPKMFRKVEFSILTDFVGFNDVNSVIIKKKALKLSKSSWIKKLIFFKSSKRKKIKNTSKKNLYNLIFADFMFSFLNLSKVDYTKKKFDLKLIELREKINLNQVFAGISEVSEMLNMFKFNLGLQSNVSLNLNVIHDQVFFFVYGLKQVLRKYVLNFDYYLNEKKRELEYKPILVRNFNLAVLNKKVKNRTLGGVRHYTLLPDGYFKDKEKINGESLPPSKDHYEEEKKDEQTPRQDHYEEEKKEEEGNKKEKSEKKIKKKDEGSKDHQDADNRDISKPRIEELRRLANQLDGLSYEPILIDEDEEEKEEKVKKKECGAPMPRSSSILLAALKKKAKARKISEKGNKKNKSRSKKKKQGNGDRNGGWFHRIVSKACRKWGINWRVNGTRRNRGNRNSDESGKGNKESNEKSCKGGISEGIKEKQNNIGKKYMTNEINDQDTEEKKQEKEDSAKRWLVHKSVGRNGHVVIKKNTWKSNRKFKQVNNSSKMESNNIRWRNKRDALCIHRNWAKKAIQQAMSQESEQVTSAKDQIFSNFFESSQKIREKKNEKKLSIDWFPKHWFKTKENTFKGGTRKFFSFEIATEEASKFVGSWPQSDYPLLLHHNVDLRLKREGNSSEMLNLWAKTENLKMYRNRRKRKLPSSYLAKASFFIPLEGLEIGDGTKINGPKETDIDSSKG